MQLLKNEELCLVQGAGFTAEHAVSGGLSEGLLSSGGAALYLGLASNPVGWVAMGIIGAGAVGGSLYYMITK